MTKDDIRASVQDTLKTEYGQYLLMLTEEQITLNLVYHFVSSVINSQLVLTSDKKAAFLFLTICMPFIGHTFVLMKQFFVEIDCWLI